jgi:ribulose 1,5-bisphosphate synthetase/thiazole synthase
MLQIIITVTCVIMMANGFQKLPNKLSTSISRSSSRSSLSSSVDDAECDVAIIGAGIGGLSSAAILSARYGI